MSIHTPIEWCDSTVNPVMGCDGCELWTPPEDGERHCYAGTLHERYGGQKGYADAFLQPKLFPGRMAVAARWSDLRGTLRADKPWLNGLPRVVFISDMGDALSKDVPFEFLRTEVIDTTSTWRHVGMWLTKQPQRMAAFAEWLATRGVGWPASLWAGTSITSSLQIGRIAHLVRVPAAVRFLSIEPLLSPIDVSPHLAGIDLVIVGGESGSGARPFVVEWARSIVAQCKGAGVSVFVKQLGSFVKNDKGRRIWLKNKKGGDPDEWETDLRVRQFPGEVLTP